MSLKQQQINNKNHSRVKSISGIGRSGRNRVRSRSRQLKTIGKIYDNLQENKNPASVIQKVHLYEKQREFLAAQAEVFERRTASLRDEIRTLTEKIAQQKKHAQTVFLQGAGKNDGESGTSDDVYVDDTKRSSVESATTRPKSKPKTNKKNIFSIKY
jgi:coproporphyrinogen III oxidase-like Fe-S oxidoreductase